MSRRCMRHSWGWSTMLRWEEGWVDMRGRGWGMSRRGDRNRGLLVRHSRSWGSGSWRWDRLRSWWRAKWRVRCWSWGSVPFGSGRGTPGVRWGWSPYWWWWTSHHNSWRRTQSSWGKSWWELHLWGRTRHRWHTWHDWGTCRGWACGWGP